MTTPKRTDKRRAGPGFAPPREGRVGRGPALAGRHLAALLAAAMWPALAAAQVHKCQQPDGRIVYSQAPCVAAGGQALGELKIAPPPAPAVPTPTRSTLPPPAGEQRPAAAPTRPRPPAPPGVDDPFADPTRPQRCAEQQNTLDASVARIRMLEAEQQAQAAHFEAEERRIDEFHASPDGQKRRAFNIDNRYAIRNQEKAAMTERLGKERVLLSAHVQNANALNCAVLDSKFRLAEALRLQSQPVGGPARGR
ncbi:MAG: hypothetical protein HY855_25205 [Burkholderiales bacterium]|nr:hypothetical protein [Burkholderiales bacterium]